MLHGVALVVLELHRVVPLSVFCITLAYVNLRVRYQFIVKLLCLHVTAEHVFYSG